MTYTISDLITSKLFLCFRVRHSNVFNVCVIFFKVIHFVLQLGLETNVLGSYLQSKWPPKQQKTVETKNCENQKAKRWFMLLWNRLLRIWQYSELRISEHLLGNGKSVLLSEVFSFPNFCWQKCSLIWRVSLNGGLNHLNPL